MIKEWIQKKHAELNHHLGPKNPFDALKLMIETGEGPFENGYENQLYAITLMGDLNTPAALKYLQDISICISEVVEQTSQGDYGNDQAEGWNGRTTHTTRYTYPYLKGELRHVLRYETKTIRDEQYGNILNESEESNISQLSSSSIQTIRSAIEELKKNLNTRK